MHRGSAIPSGKCTSNSDRSSNRSFSMRSFFRTASATAAVLTLTIGSSRGAQAQQPASTQFKMAFVNTAILLDNAPDRAQAESTYARETRSYGDQLKKMSDSLNT